MNQDSPRWMGRTLAFAAGYNLVWGALVVLFPFTLFDFAGLARPLYPWLWQSIGMIVGIYGVGYAIAATDPLRHWPIVLVGLLGEILGPLGFLWVAGVQGELPWTAGLTIIANDLVWWVPFSLILIEGLRAKPVEIAGRARRSLHDIIHSSGAVRRTSLAELSRMDPVLVVFLRHFGCTFCREALADLQKKRKEIEAAGVRLALVHMATDADAEEFFARYDLENVARISDPNQELYDAFGLTRGTVGQLFGLKVWWRGLVAGIVHGHGMGRLIGDGFQMPGVFLLEDGRIVTAYRHRSAADRPDYESLACHYPGGTRAA